MHWFIAPHLDDAVLSCGGLIRQLVAQGVPVMVQTVMAGDPPERWPITALVAELHARWAAGEHPAPPPRRH
ncbi:MAG: hypothetical protein HC915_21930 [Anaerolineae bacterium]|nr:hypothetical protein [Anaerolineae bacterium]